MWFATEASLHCQAGHVTIGRHQLRSAQSVTEVNEPFTISFKSLWRKLSIFRPNRITPAMRSLAFNRNARFQIRASPTHVDERFILD
jgi:hypothetical protein